MAFLKDAAAAAVIIDNAFNYELFETVWDYYDEDGNVSEEYAHHQSVRKIGEDVYVEFTPEYRIDWCRAKVNRYGEISAEFIFKHSDGHIWCQVCTVDELKAKFGLSEVVVEAA